ncbi:hypothetical protein D3C81_384500 [compost metagenome]
MKKFDEAQMLYELVNKGAKIALVTTTSFETYIEEVIEKVAAYYDTEFKNRGPRGYGFKYYGIFKKFNGRPDAFEHLDYAILGSDWYDFTDDIDIKHAAQYNMETKAGLIVQLREDKIYEKEDLTDEEFDNLRQKQIDKLLKRFDYVVNIDLNYERTFFKAQGE